jgi:hypothetical protein
MRNHGKHLAWKTDLAAVVSREKSSIAEFEMEPNRFLAMTSARTIT